MVLEKVKGIKLELEMVYDVTLGFSETREGIFIGRDPYTHRGRILVRHSKRDRRKEPRVYTFEYGSHSLNGRKLIIKDSAGPHFIKRREFEAVIEYLRKKIGAQND